MKSILYKGDKVSSVCVYPGCSIELYQHYLTGCNVNGIVYTFKHNKPENNDLRKVSLDNTVSSYICKCGRILYSP